MILKASQLLGIHVRLRLIVVVCINVFLSYKVGVVVNQLGIQSAIRPEPEQQSPDPRSHVDRNLTGVTATPIQFAGLSKESNCG